MREKLAQVAHEAWANWWNKQKQRIDSDGNMFTAGMIYTLNKRALQTYDSLTDFEKQAYRRTADRCASITSGPRLPISDEDSSQ